MRLSSRAALFATLLLTMLAVAVSPRPGVAAQTNSITSARFTWHDAKREREVPVKIYSPASGQGPFPVVIFSHGLGGTREGYEYLGRYWASHGHVSVHVQHPGSDDSIWRGVGLGQRQAAMRRAAADPRNAINRPRDVSFVIDELERMNREESSFRNRLDLARLGVAGHSFGAFTALAIAGQVFAPGTDFAGSLADPRVKAVIPMSAPIPANKQRLDESYAKVRIPCLHMTGTRDASPIGDSQPEERRMPFDHCRNSDQFLITFKDGDHMIFSGRGRRPAEPDRTFQALICESTTAFWNAYLRGDGRAQAWLTNDFKAVLGTSGTFEMKLPE